MKDKSIMKPTLTILALFILFIQASCDVKDNTKMISDQIQINQSDTMTYEKKLIEVNQKISKIKTGTTREEIDKIFPIEDGGIQVSSSYRYYEHPEVMIEVPYDTTGGKWNKQNKVNGSIKVYKSLMHID